MDNKSNLTINVDVIASLASIAAKEVNGVASMAGKTEAVKNVLNRGKLFKPVKVTEKNGAVCLDLYICIYDNVNAKDVAEEVQKNVKEKIQSMTGNAITKVNVTVADVKEAKED